MLKKKDQLRHIAEQMGKKLAVVSPCSVYYTHFSDQMYDSLVLHLKYQEFRAYCVWEMQR